MMRRIDLLYDNIKLPNTNSFNRNFYSFEFGAVGLTGLISKKTSTIGNDSDSNNNTTNIVNKR